MTHNPYGAPVTPPDGASLGAYAHWGKRVGATLVDGLLLLLTMVPYFVGVAIAATQTETTPSGTTRTPDSAAGILLVTMAISLVLYLGFFIWNICLRQGRTGQTLGKSALGIKVLGEQTGQPIGAGMAFVRQLLHFVDGLPCYLGYLWPLWDAKRQTFADKILNTVVVEA